MRSDRFKGFLMLFSHYLQAALIPRSVALVGASRREGALGTHVWRNLLAGGFKGKVYAVNPKYRELEGQRSYARLKQLPEAPDLVVIVTPAATVPDLIDEAAAAGAGAVIVLSAGFGEAGAAGKALQADVLARARKRDIRVLGPNCVGILRPDIGLNATFVRTAARPGSVALVSQSGAVIAAMLDFAWSAGFGFSSVVSTGAGSDVEFSEILDFLALDPATRSIVLYVEGVHDARTFVSSVRAATSAKPVVVLKVGRHLSGSKAALSHTGALVGNDAVFDAALKRAGAVRVGAYAQMFSAAEVLAAGRFPEGAPANRLAIVTNGGGPGALAADVAADNGIELATLAPETRAALDRVLPSVWSHGNPVDIIGDADAQRFATALDLVLRDPGNDGVLVLFCPTIVLGAEAAAHALLPIVQASEKPVITAWLGAADAGKGRAIFETAGLPSPSSPERGVEAFGYLARFVAGRRMRLQVPPPQVAAFDPNYGDARAIAEAALAQGRQLLDERESKALLACFGVPVATTRMATSAAEAVNFAHQIGFPVAVKVMAEGVTHKSEVGGVMLDLGEPQQVAEAFETLRARTAQRAPQARFVGVLVQQMVRRPHGRELLVGLARDAIFGPVVSFGLGGTAVEVLRDTAISLPPLNRFLAQDLIGRTKAARLLDRFRGQPPADSEALIDILLKVSDLACELPCVGELDINPLLADENGVIVLDARIVLTTDALAPDARYSHLAIHPYPRLLEQPIALDDGAALMLRPIRPEDTLAEQRFVARLSPRTMFLRFHAPLRELSTERLLRFTQIDYDREMAFVALDEAAGSDEIRGVVRYSRNPDGVSAEFGITVEDAWQGRGLGGHLMQALETCAHDRGIERLIGYVLADNKPMTDMMQRRGYVQHGRGDQDGVVQFIHELPRAR